MRSRWLLVNLEGEIGVAIHQRFEELAENLLHKAASTKVQEVPK